MGNVGISAYRAWRVYADAALHAFSLHILFYYNASWYSDVHHC